MNKSDLQFLKNHHACKESMIWLKKGRYESLQKAWKDCDKGIWMLWLLKKRKFSDKQTWIALSIMFFKNIQNIYEKKYHNNNCFEQIIKILENYLKPQDIDIIAGITLEISYYVALVIARDAINDKSILIDNNSINYLSDNHDLMIFLQIAINDTITAIQDIIQSDIYRDNEIDPYVILVTSRVYYEKQFKKQANQIRELIPELPESKED